MGGAKGKGKGKGKKGGFSGKGDGGKGFQGKGGGKGGHGKGGKGKERTKGPLEGNIKQKIRSVERFLKREVQTAIAVATARPF